MGADAEGSDERQPDDQQVGVVDAADRLPLEGGEVGVVAEGLPDASVKMRATSARLSP